MNGDDTKRADDDPSVEGRIDDPGRHRLDDGGEDGPDRDGRDDRTERPSAAEIEECLRLLDEIWPGHAARASDAVPRRLGKFRIRRELGRGGFGVVFLAEDVQLGRKVALKVPRVDFVSHPEAWGRFRREARAASRFHHPNLVPLLEVGALGPVGYIVSAYVPGPSLDRWIREHRRGVPPRWAAGIAATLARVVASIHRQGILHRDLKPANVLLHAPGVEADPADPATWRDVPIAAWVPQICDFGLAKLQEADGIETRTRMVCGSPAYMAPEQAEARRGEIGPATDVYGIGAVLYAMLTGRAPFAGESDLDTLRRVAEDEPVPPRARNPEVSRDLETICLKCLAKRPERRYATADELAEDLERFLDGRAIAARPAPAWERLGRWFARNPERRMLAAAVVVAALSLAIAVLSRGSTASRGPAPSSPVRTADDPPGRYRPREQADYRIRLAQEAAGARNIEVALGLLDEAGQGLGPPADRGFAWSYLHRFLTERLQVYRGHRRPVSCVAVDPSGRLIASGDEGGEIRIWDRRGGRCRVVPSGSDEPIWRLAFSSDGRVLASAIREFAHVRLWDVASGRLLGVPESHDPVNVLTLSFADGDRRLASIQSRDYHAPTVALSWDLTRPGDRPPVAPADDPTSKALARVDERLRTIADMLDEGPARDVPTRDELARSWGGRAAHGVACTRDRAYVVFAPGDGTFAVHRAGTPVRLAWGCVKPSGTLLCLSDVCPPPLPSLPRQRERLENLARGLGVVGGSAATKRRADRLYRIDRLAPIALAPRGDEAAVWDDRAQRLAVVELTTGREADVFDWPTSGPPCSLGFLDGGDSLAIGGWDNQLRVWGRHPAERLVVLDGHAPAEAWAVAFAPGGRTLATAGDDNQVRLWDLETNRSETLPDGHASLVTSIAFSPDGRTLATGSFDAKVILWDVPLRRPRARLRGHQGRIRAVAYSPDGRYIASGGDDHCVIVWDARDGGVVERLTDHSDKVSALAFSPDGRTLASGGLDRRIILTDLLARRSRSLDAHEQVFGLAFTPDGARLVSGHDGGSVLVWGVARGTGRTVLPGGGPDILGVAISPDGLTLATAGEDRAVRVWDLATAQQVLALTDCRARVNAVAFSPDGMRLAGADHSGAIAIWDARPR